MIDQKKNKISEEWGGGTLPSPRGRDIPVNECFLSTISNINIFNVDHVL